MSMPYFTSTPTGFVPSATASSPWGPDMLHGRFLGGLAARAVEQEIDQAAWRVARVSVDLFRPAAMQEVSVQLEMIRDGRRICVFDVSLFCAGHKVARVVAVALKKGHEPPGRIWAPSYRPWPSPESCSTQDSDGNNPNWLINAVDGGFGTGNQTRMWTNDTGLLVDDEPLSPLVRAALTGDIACPIANSSDQGLHYINGDYNLLLGRYPIGEWIGLETSTHLASDGISVAGCILVDEVGPFATSSGVSLVTEALTIQ